MTPIPRAALILGLAGLIPFVWGALGVLSPDLSVWAGQVLGRRFAAPYVQLGYGTIILAFMSGVLWGFAARADDSAVRGYGLALSTLPALWAFVMVSGGVTNAAIQLMVGFVAVLVLDGFFAYLRLTPPWWMPLRIMLSAITLICLGVTAFA